MRRPTSAATQTFVSSRSRVREGVGFQGLPGPTRTYQQLPATYRTPTGRLPGAYRAARGNVPGDGEIGYRRYQRLPMGYRLGANSNLQHPRSREGGEIPTANNQPPEKAGEIPTANLQPQ